MAISTAIATAIAIVIISVPLLIQARKRPELLVRLKTITLVVPPFLFVIWCGGLVFFTMMLLLAWLALRELGPVLRAPGDRALVRGALSLGYLSLGMITWTALRFLPAGYGLVIFLLATVQLSDAAALLGGRAFGRRKLAPSISPNKTWEGLVTGLFAAGLTGVAFAFCLPELSALKRFALALLLSLAGVAGDLFASWLKRKAQLDDFGSVLPGHGGVLDRIDGYLVAAPVAWGLAMW